MKQALSIPLHLLHHCLFTKQAYWSYLEVGFILRAQRYLAEEPHLATVADSPGTPDGVLKDLHPGSGGSRPDQSVLQWGERETLNAAARSMKGTVLLSISAARHRLDQHEQDHSWTSRSGYMGKSRNRRTDDNRHFSEHSAAQFYDTRVMARRSSITGCDQVPAEWPIADGGELLAPYRSVGLRVQVGCVRKRSLRSSG
jgi:hypothetical protein